MAEYGGDWRKRSACLREDPNLFFPDGAAGAALSQMKFARQVCQRCPVQLDCLQLALSANISDGVWGGMTPEERRSFRRRHDGTGFRRVDIQTLEAMLRKQEASPPQLSYERRIAAEALACTSHGEDDASS